MIVVRALKMDQGRFYNAEDEIQHARVAVIGSEANEKLFPDAMLSVNTSATTA